MGKTGPDAHGDVFRGLEVVEHACGMDVSDGNCLGPTIFSNVTPEMAIYKEEYSHHLEVNIVFVRAKNFLYRELIL